MIVYDICAIYLIVHSRRVAGSKAIAIVRLSEAPFSMSPGLDTREDEVMLPGIIRWNLLVQRSTFHPRHVLGNGILLHWLLVAVDIVLYASYTQCMTGTCDAMFGLEVVVSKQELCTLQ